MATAVVRDSTVRSHYESVDRVITAMRSHIDQPLSLQSMAKVACASPFHFNRTFRHVTGVPPSQFLYALRLDAARRLLMQTERKIIDICYDVGYNSVGTFTRRFTDLLGVSPSTFRDLARLPLIHRPEFPAPMVISNGHLKKSPMISGRVHAPADFRGFVFVGLFSTPVPQGRPVAGTIADERGFYCLDDVPEGEFHLFALGLEQTAPASAYFQYDSVLRAGGHSITVTRNSVHEAANLYLRPPSPFDPPILLVLALLIEEYFERMEQVPPAVFAAPAMLARAQG